MQFEEAAMWLKLQKQRYGVSGDCAIHATGFVSNSRNLQIFANALYREAKRGSQIAEALGKHLASDIFESYSAGTETKPQINQDAVRIMKEIYGIDMEANGQHSKLITDIPDVDIAISMGCNVGCPFIGRAFDDNWGLDDPTGKSDDDFKAVIQRIEENIIELKKRLSES